MKTPRAKTPKLKRREQATPARRHHASAADLQKQLDQRTRELAEARKNLAEAHEQQKATSEVLRVISSSSGELAPVFESLLASAKHLCGAEFGIILLREGDAFRTVALHGATAEYTEARWRAPLIRPAADTGLGRVLKTKQVGQIADVQAVAGSWALRSPTRHQLDRSGKEGHGGRPQGGVQASTSGALQRIKRPAMNHIRFIRLKTGSALSKSARCVYASGSADRPVLGKLARKGSAF